MLLRVGRLEDAATELRGALVDDPEDAYAHALLALTECDLGHHGEALDEAREAMRIAPDSRTSLLALSTSLLYAGRLEEAATAAADLIAAAPWDARGFVVLARARLGQERAEDALAAAEHALAVDAENGDAANLRSLALLKLGRRQEAGRSSEAAVARAPESAVAHNVRGWALLHAGDAEQALVHFREALRLDPTLDNAREGLVLTLKARHRLYSLILSYFLWLDRMPARRRQGLIIGAFVGARVVSAAGGHGTVVNVVVTTLVVAYLLFVLATWMADPLFNLVLRFNRLGKEALAPRDRLSADLLAACLVAAVVALIGGLVLDRLMLYGAAVAFGLLGIPTAVVARASPGWPRRVATGWLVLVAGLAVVGAATAAAFGGGPGSALLIALSAIGSLISTWLSMLPEERRGRGLQRFGRR